MYRPDPKHNGVNLVAEIKILEDDIKTAEEKFDDKWGSTRQRVEELREINTACEKCNATGMVLRQRACAEDDRPDPDNPADYRDCPECSGSGLSKEARNGKEKM